jgi:thiamine pyrophosphokinase
MKPAVRSSQGVTLVGGGELAPDTLAQARDLAPVLAAADGGVRHLLGAGLMPEAVIGDLDSIDPAHLAALPPGRIRRVAEQDSTDFDKSLRLIRAPFVVAVGFGGERIDHTLAGFATLARNARRACFWLSARDVAFLAPRALDLELPEGLRFSLFPLGPVRGESEGLRWPIGGMRFAPAGLIGTSNEVSAPRVRLRFSAARMLVILPAAQLGAAVSARLAADRAAGDEAAVPGE